MNNNGSTMNEDDMLVSSLLDAVQDTAEKSSKAGQEQRPILHRTAIFCTALYYKLSLYHTLL